MVKLAEICSCESKMNSGDEFVGIRCEKVKETGIFETKIVFPLGYFKNDDELKSQTEESLRESIFNLFSVLADPSLQSDVSQDSNISVLVDDPAESTFPMVSYINVIRSFLDFGYISEKETIYKKGASGKVHWGRTIKTTKPVVEEDGENLVYLDLVARKVNHNEDSLISLVHKFCVHDALSRLGFLFGIEPTETPMLSFDYDLFCNAINSRLAKTFVDRDLHLLADLARIVEYLAGHRTDDGNAASEFYYGVNTFAPVWEAMVDKIFEKLPQGVAKDRFNPHLRWNGSVLDVESEEEKVLNDPKRSTLRPDTIMVNGDDLFVLDSKYYKFGVVDEKFDRKHFLPGAESVCKQMAYAEYAEQLMPGKKIFNAFIMPYCADDKSTSANLTSPSINSVNFGMKSEGYIYGDWKKVPDAERPYHKIACILLDVKSVMRNYATSPDAQGALAGLIKEHFR